jgi:glycosyltransferase involved in cell wall biosynthesis
MKIALTHDWLIGMGGAEKIIEQFLELFPDAPIFTAVVNQERLSMPLQNANIISSFLQKRYSKKSSHKKYFPLMPMAFESFDLNGFDVVISSSSSCAKGIVTAPDVMHVCYCHSPMRYGWEFYYDYIHDMNGFKKTLVKYLMNYMRIWDVISANRVDYFIANSEYVANRIWKHYRRESTVIYPPVNTEFYTPGIESEKEDYFLCLSRLVAYKRIDLAVRAFNELGFPLVVIGDGEELERLKGIANTNVRFLGRQSDETVREYYRKCRAFVFPGEEDFGIAPVEAQACGTPVIAFGKGGVLETVIEGVTGLFFKNQTVESLKDTVIKFQNQNFSSERCRMNAERFNVEDFKHYIVQFIEEQYREFNADKHWSVENGDKVKW